MSSEQKRVRGSRAFPAAGSAAKNGARDALARPARPAATLPAEVDRLELRVSFPRKGEYHEENSRLLPLLANRWERLEIPLPADWQGGGLRLDPRCRFGLMEIVGVRIVSGVMGESLWEMLGRDLMGGVRVSAGMQVLSNKLRLRLLCTGDDAQIVLPDLVLPSAEVPLVLELGLRVRTDLASIGYTLHEWVDDANTKLREAVAHLAAAEAARTYSDGWAKALLSEVEVARTDGNQREAALQQQLADAHEAARRHAAALVAEIETARAYGEERAAALVAEIEVARTDGSQQVAALRSQLAAAREAAQTHAAALLAEIETARTDGNQREAALQQQLADAHEAARRHAAALVAEIETARAYGEERAAALVAEIEVARTDGSQQVAALRSQLAAAREAAQTHAAALLAEIDAARADGNQREAALQVQLAAAHEAARIHADTLLAEIEKARAHGDERAKFLTSQLAQSDERAAALMTTIHEAHLHIEHDRQQRLELSENTALLQRELTAQRSEVQRLAQTLDFSNQQKANVHAELAEARRLSEEHRGRVRSMQRSLSWRLTLPLRMVRRALTGRRPARRHDAA